jgi:hypothetical protein
MHGRSAAANARGSDCPPGCFVERGLHVTFCGALATFDGADGLGAPVSSGLGATREPYFRKWAMKALDADESSSMVSKR